MSELPVLMAHSPLTRLLMIKAHKEDHRSSNITLWWSKAQAWIMQGGRLATKVEKECQLCTIKKMAVEQRMGDNDKDSVTPSWPWHSIALDLMGPVKV